MALACLFAAPVSAKSLEDAKWIEVTTPNFQIRSLLGKTKTVDMARHLELLQVAVSDFTNIEITASPVPTYIYAVRSEKDFDIFNIDDGVAGVFQAKIRDNTILIRDTRGMDESAIIMHEYVHFLLRNHGGFNYPRWYDEGFAEYFGASKIHGKKFEVGIASDHRIPGLALSKWIEGDELLSSTAFSDLDDDDKSMFYGQAWLLVHYLQHSEENSVVVADAINKYAALIAEGAGEIESFERAFQIEASSLEETLDTYMRKERTKYYSIPIEKLLPEFSPTIRKLSREEAALGLAQLAVRRGDLSIAQEWFEIALTRGETRARALSGMGVVQYSLGENEKAEQQLKEGLSLEPENPAMHLNMANYWIARAKTASLPSARDEFLGFARSNLLAAWKIDSTIPEIYAMNGATQSLETIEHQAAAAT